MNTLGQPAEERRLYKQGRCGYLLNDEAKTAWIVKGQRIGRRKRFRVPEYVMIDGERYTIESIEIGAYKKAKCLKHLIIPDSITFVDEYNFSSLPCLRSINIGKGLEHTSSWIFHSNKKLRSFIISKDNPYLKIEGGIIYEKDYKRAIATPFQPRVLKIKEGVEEIYDVAFWYDKNLESIVFPSTLKKIGDNSFTGCPKLKEVILPEGFEVCVVQCFWGNLSLEYVDLPSTTKALGWETFFDCPKLRKLIIRCPYVLVPDAWYNTPFAIPSCCILYVPAELVEEYKQHPLWSMCKNIKEL